MTPPFFQNSADLPATEDQGCNAQGLLHMGGRGSRESRLNWRSPDDCQRLRVNLTIHPRYAELSNNRDRTREIGGLFGIPYKRRTWTAVAAAIDAFIATSGLPPLVPVFESGVAGIIKRRQQPFNDPRLAVAVLSKSSSKAFLLSRPPLLSGVDPARDLVLALPLEWKSK